MKEHLLHDHMLIERRVSGGESLEKRLLFEQMLTGFSARLMAARSDRVDNEIEHALGVVREFLNAETIALLEVREDNSIAGVTHASCGEGAAGLPGKVLPNGRFAWSRGQRLKGEHPGIRRTGDLSEEPLKPLYSFGAGGTASTLTIPLPHGGRVSNMILVQHASPRHIWPEEYISRLRLLGGIFLNALERRKDRIYLEEQLKERRIEIEELKQRIETENVYLREEVRSLVDHPGIVGQSAVMKKVLAQAEQVARTDSSVLIQGETGTGKELLARAVHVMSRRKDRTLVVVNCAALPPSLIESELFGREKGAYTGALTRMTGRFELADGSSLFLDEIGELPLELQGKLLRVLEQGQFERLGSNRTIKVDVRIIAATNRDLEREVKEGRFRSDLFYRLKVFPLVIPPLRDRPDDIPLLVRAVVREFQKRMGKEIESIPKKTMQALQSYSWPGNVRELRNLIEHAMIVSRGKTLDVRVPRKALSGPDSTASLTDIERTHMIAVLKKTGWRISGQGGAAEVLGMKRTTLQAKMKKLGIMRFGTSMGS